MSRNEWSMSPSYEEDGRFVGVVVSMGIRPLLADQVVTNVLDLSKMSSIHRIDMVSVLRKGYGTLSDPERNIVNAVMNYTSHERLALWFFGTKYNRISLGLDHGRLFPELKAMLLMANKQPDNVLRLVNCNKRVNTYCEEMSPAIKAMAKGWLKDGSAADYNSCRMQAADIIEQGKQITLQFTRQAARKVIQHDEVPS